MNCKHCGAQLWEGAKFCIACGQPVPPSDVQSGAQTANVTVYARSQSMQAEDKTEVQQQTATQPRPNRLPDEPLRPDGPGRSLQSKRTARDILPVVLVCLLCAAVLVAGTLLVSRLVSRDKAEAEVPSVSRQDLPEQEKAASEQDKGQTLNVIPGPQAPAQELEEAGVPDWITPYVGARWDKAGNTMQLLLVDDRVVVKFGFSVNGRIVDSFSDTADLEPGLLMVSGKTQIYGNEVEGLVYIGDFYDRPGEVFAQCDLIALGGEAVDRTEFELSIFYDHDPNQGTDMPEESQEPDAPEEPEKPEKPAQMANADDYILPDSASRYLDDEDLEDLSWKELCLARNEIYARHGRIFATAQIAQYFESQDWYEGTVPGATFDANTGAYLNQYENANADFILSYERTHFGGSYY